MSNNNLEKIDELERGLVEAERESYESKIDSLPEYTRSNWNEDLYSNEYVDVFDNLMAEKIRDRNIWKRFAKKLENKTPEWEFEKKPMMLGYAYDKVGLKDLAKKYWIKAGNQELDRFCHENAEEEIHLFDRNTKRNIDDSLVLKHFIFSINHYSAGGLTKPECWKQIGEYLLEERGPRCLFSTSSTNVKDFIASIDYFKKSNPKKEELDKFSIKVAKKLISGLYGSLEDARSVCKENGLESEVKNIFIGTADEIVEDINQYAWGDKAIGHIFKLYSEAGLTKEQCKERMMKIEAKELKKIDGDIKERESLEGSIYDEQLKHIETDCGRDEFLRTTKWLKKADLEGVSMYRNGRKKEMDNFLEGVMVLYDKESC